MPDDPAREQDNPAIRAAELFNAWRDARARRDFAAAARLRCDLHALGYMISLGRPARLMKLKVRT